MAVVAGYTGGVEIGTAISGIKSWTLDYTREELDATIFASSGYYALLPGIIKGSGTFEGYKDGVPKDHAAGTSVVLTLKETSTGNQTWSGTAYILGVHAGSGIDQVVTYAYDFTYTGTITIPTA